MSSSNLAEIQKSSQRKEGVEGCGEGGLSFPGFA